MKCPHCEMETDKLVNSLGACKLCYKRYQNMKSRGIKYTKLKDIKGTIEYNRVMGRRQATIERHEKNHEKNPPHVTTSVTYPPKAIVKKNTSNDLDTIKKKAKDEVLKDIQHFKDVKGIKDLMVDYNQLVMGFDLLYMVLTNDLDRNIDLTKQIFDSLMIDYFHEVKPNNQFDNLEDYALHGAKEAYLQELRTPIIYLDKANSILDEVFALLKLDNNFMTNLKDVKRKLDEFIKGINKNIYLTTAPSMQKYDFVINKDRENRNLSIPHIQNKYSARIKKARGLYGNMSYKPFDYKPPIYADDVEEAKEKFIEILLKDFGSLNYDTDDIQISLYTEKECL